MGLLKNWLEKKAADKKAEGDLETVTTTTTVSGEIEVITTTETTEVELACIHIGSETSSEFEIFNFDFGGDDDCKVEVIVEETVEKESLPFPLCPGEFWAEAIKTIYGPRHLLVGYANSFEVRESTKKTVEIGPMLTGMTVEIGLGECETIDDEQFFKVNLSVIDYKSLNHAGGITVEVDSDRSGGKCCLVAKNVHRILAKFAKFSNQLNWKSLTDEYNVDKVEFYRHYIEMFYPASASININTKFEVDWSVLKVTGLTGKKTLINKKYITLYADEILNFPPASVEFTPNEHIELIETMGGKVVTRVDRFETKYIFPFITESKDVTILENVLKTQFTFDQVKTLVTKYFLAEGHIEHQLVTELPFPTNPAQFWLEGLKYVHGENHLFLGISNSFNLRFQDDHTNAGSMLSGLTVKLHEGKSHEKNGKKIFQILLNIVDFKMQDKTGHCQMEFDSSRPGGQCSITALHSDKIVEVFEVFTKRSTWKTFVTEYEQNRVRFYKKYIDIFGPSEVSLSFNVKKTIDGSKLDIQGFGEKKIFINREVIHFTNTKVTEFPPQRFNITPAHPIELVTIEKPKDIVLTIGKFDTSFVTPEYNDKDEVTFIKEHITSHITFEFVREKVTKYVITKLPFPDTPAAFWAEAIKTIYGKRQLLIGSVDNFSLCQLDNTEINVGKMHSGIVVEILEGKMQKVGDQTVMAVGLNIVDYKLVDEKGGVEVEYDNTRKQEECALVLEHVDKVNEWFSGFSKNLDVLTLVHEFNKCPVTFYKKHIHRFYPAIVSLGVNVKKVVDSSFVHGKEGHITLINKDTITLFSDQILNFPPSNTNFGITSHIELVMESKPKEVVVKINNFTNSVIHVTFHEDEEVNIVNDVIESGLTFEFIKEKVTKYIVSEDHKHHDIVELPFSVEPCRFWEEAITTLYGKEHLLLGIADNFKMNGPDGKPVEFGNMFNGLSYKIKEVKTKTEDVRIVFEIVDFKLVSKDGKNKIEHNKKKPAEFTLVVKNTEKIIDLFQKFQKPASWTTLLTEYEGNTKQFYTQYVDLFYPCEASISLDLVHLFDEKTYVTKEPVHTVKFDLVEFPPKNVVICPSKPVELIGEHDSNIKFLIEQLESKVTYPKHNDVYDVHLVNEIHKFDFTYELVHQYVIKYVVSETLPFSLRPGTFWADAIKTIYGKDHLLFGISKLFKVTTVHGKDIDLGTMLSGLTFRVTDGRTHDKDGVKVIQVILELLDFKQTSKKPGHIEFQVDKKRPADQCILTSQNADKIFLQFRKIFAEDNFEVLISEYKESPKKFYLKYIELFFPSSLTLSFNLHASMKVETLTEVKDKILVNREPVCIVYEKITQFPPTDINVIIKNPIQLVVRDDPETVILTVVKYETKIVYEVPKEEKEVKEWEKVINTGVTFDYVLWSSTKHQKQDITLVGGDDDEGLGLGLIPALPFPLCPGEFWAQGVKTVYGNNKHLLLGSSETFKIGGTEVGFMLTGMIVEVIGGTCHDEGDHLKLTLKVTDYKSTREDGGIDITVDHSKKDILCELISHNTDIISDKFNHFANPLKWKEIAVEFKKSPVEFYKNHLPAFFPAVLHLKTHLKFLLDTDIFTISGVTGKTKLFNKETITFTSEKILSFPPANLHLIPKGPVELVGENDTTLTITTVEKINTKFMYLTSTDEDVAILKKILESGLDYEFIKKYVLKYIVAEEHKHVVIPKLPFPVDMCEFWCEAIKEVYGDRHLFFGLTKEFKIKDVNGKIVSLGPMHNGFTVKIREVKQTIEKKFHLTFDIVEYKVVSQDGDIEVTHDETVGGNEITMVVEDNTKILELLSQFKKQANWAKITEEFTSGKVTFYERYLDIFYPAKLNFKLNVKYTIKDKAAKLIGFESSKFLQNKNVIEYVEILHSFPPKNIKFTPKDVIELVEHGHDKVLVGVEKTETEWIVPYKKEKPDRTIVEEIFGTGFTYECILEHVTHRIVAEHLPFSLNPAVFFSDAIRTVYGKGTLLLGNTKVFNITLSNGKEVNIGPMLNGITITFGEGTYVNGKLKVGLTIQDFKMVSKDSCVTVQLDKNRPSGDCYLVVENPEKIIQKFNQIVHKGNWEELIKHHTTDFKEFYRSYLDLFYPCTIVTESNIKLTINGDEVPHLGFEGKRIFYNKEILRVEVKEIHEFPAQKLDLTPVGPISLVENETEVVLFKVDHFKTVWIHPKVKEDKDLTVFEKVVETGVTFEFVREIVTKYICIEHHSCKTIEAIPFPLCPGEFWVEAIKTIYGSHHHLLLGNSDVFEMYDVDGSLVDDGSLLTGLILKVQEGSCESLGSHDHIKVNFDIVDLKFVTLEGNIRIEQDKSRKGIHCALEAKHVGKILEKFNEFTNPMRWTEIANKFKKDPVAFYKKVIGLYYPATLKFSFNLKRIVSETILVNREVIHIHSDDLLSFPPSNTEFHLKEIIEFVEQTKPTQIVCKITKFQTILTHLEQTLDIDFKKIFHEHLTYELIIELVLKYIIKGEHIHKIPNLPFPTDPIEFWQQGICTIFGETNMMLGLTRDFIVVNSEGSENHGPFLAGLLFKQTKVVSKSTEKYELKFEVQDFRMISYDKAVEVEHDNTTVGEITITSKNTTKITEILTKFKTNKTNWTTLIEEYNQSPVNFYTKYIAMFYPAEFKLVTHFKYTIKPVKVTYLTREPVEFCGEVDISKKSFDFIIKKPIELVENHTSTKVLYTIKEFESLWIIPDITDELELEVFEEVKKTKLTIVFIREKVTKYIISLRIPFPLCPEDFFAEAIKTIYNEGQLYLGMSHHHVLKVGGEEVEVGPLLSCMTLKVHRGEDTLNEFGTVQIRLEVLDAKFIARDGGIEIEVDKSRHDKNELAYITVNDAGEILDAFVTFFHPDKWDSLAIEFKSNPKTFYEKHLSLFFPSTISLSGHLKYHIDGSVLSIPGITTKQTLVTKEVIHYHYKNLNNFPTGDMRIKNTNTIELVELENLDKVIASVDDMETVWIYPETDDKSEIATFQQIIVSKITYKFVVEAVNKYIVTGLPFPINPGAFWAEAIKTIHGDKHLLLGLASKPNINHSNNTAFECGPILCGLITTIGDGHYNKKEGYIKLDLKLIDVKMTNLDGAVTLVHDSTKTVQTGSLICREPAKVFEKFAEFAEPRNWEVLIDEFEKNPKKFYEKHVKVYYPARVVYNLGMKATIGGGKAKVNKYTGSKFLVTKESFQFACEAVPYFPPASFFFTPTAAVKLYDQHTLKTVGAIIAHKKMLWIHPSREEKSEIEICLKAVQTGLSFDYIRQMVNVYMDVPVWKQPSKFHFDYVEL